jgi:hypothetical protein
MIRGLRAALVGVLVAVAVAGCETRVKEGLQEKLEARAAQGKQKVDEMLAERNATTKEKLPKDLTWNGEGEHPLQQWRTETADLGYEEKFRAMEPKYPGQPLQKDLRNLAAFLEAQRKFWGAAADQDYQQQEYYQFLKGYGKSNPESPFIDDILFDEVFIHASRLFKLKDVKPEDQPTSVFRFWQLAFDLPSKDSEGFGVYVARLCDELNNDEFIAKLSGGDEQFASKLKGFCKDIPFEFRHIAVMSPYYDLLIRKLEAVKKARPESPYVPVVDYLIGVFQEEQQKLAKEFEEYPVLPDTMAAMPAPVRLALEVGPRGLRFADTWLRESEDASFTLDSTEASALRPEVAKKLNDVRAAGEPDLKSGELFVLATKEAKVGPVVTLATAPDEAEENTLNQVIYLVGRRRFDGTNARASLPVILTKGAPEVTLTLSENALTCQPFGYSGEATNEVPAPTAVLYVAGGSLKGGVINPETRVVDQVALEMPAGEIDLNKVSEWVGEQKDAVLVGAAGDAEWQDFVRAIGPVAFRCKKLDCTDAELRGAPKAVLATCR